MGSLRRASGRIDGMSVFTLVMGDEHENDTIPSLFVGRPAGVMRTYKG